MRAVAILLMIQVHFVENLSQPGEYKTLYQISSDITGCLAAPLFTFLVGISLFISLKKQKDLGRPTQKIRVRTMGRGIFLFFLGLVFAITIWGPTGLFGWDILTLIAFSILIFYPLRSIRPIYLVFISLGIVILSPLLREWTHYSSYWDQSVIPPDYTYALTFSGIFLGFLVNGYFPVFPWLAFPILGFATSCWFLDEFKNRRDHGLLGAGLGLMVIAGIAMLVNSKLKPSGILNWYFSSWEFYPATTSFIMATLGLTLLMFYLLRVFLDLRPVRSRRWMTFFRRYSLFSLTTYVVHHAVHLWPVRAAGAIWHQDHMYYHANVMNPLLALVFAIAFIFLFYICLIIWEQYGSRYSLEWIQSRFIR